MLVLLLCGLWEKSEQLQRCSVYDEFKQGAAPS